MRLRAEDKHITVLEAQDRVLARVAGEPLSRFYEAEHRSHGVDVHLEVTVESIEEADGAAAGVRLASGEVLAAQMVIVGIGIIPAVEQLIAAGAEGGNGVTVDPHCQTSLAHIYAIGDCALHRNTFSAGGWIRLESVQNANDQAVVAAKAIMGEKVSYRAIPWFWSNQYDLRLQTVGLSIGYDDVVVRGDLARRSFSVVYLRNSVVVALDCVNATKDFVQGIGLRQGHCKQRRPLQCADPAQELCRGTHANLLRTNNANCPHRTRDQRQPPNRVERAR